MAKYRLYKKNNNKKSVGYKGNVKRNVPTA